MRKCFTLMEFIVVVAIVAVLFAMCFPRFIGSYDNETAPIEYRFSVESKEFNKELQSSIYVLCDKVDSARYIMVRNSEGTAMVKQER